MHQRRESKRIGQNLKVTQTHQMYSCSIRFVPAIHLCPQLIFTITACERLWITLTVQQQKCVWHIKCCVYIQQAIYYSNQLRLCIEKLTPIIDFMWLCVCKHENQIASLTVTSKSVTGIPNNQSIKNNLCICIWLWFKKNPGSTNKHAASKKRRMTGSVTGSKTPQLFPENWCPAVGRVSLSSSTSEQMN